MAATVLLLSLSDAGGDRGGDARMRAVPFGMRRMGELAESEAQQAAFSMPMRRARGCVIDNLLDFYFYFFSPSNSL